MIWSNFRVTLHSFPWALLSGHWLILFKLSYRFAPDRSSDLWIALCTVKFRKIYIPSMKVRTLCPLFLHAQDTLTDIGTILCSTVVAYSLLSCGYLLISVPKAMILAHLTDSAWRYGPFHGRDGSSSALPISVNGQIRCSSYSWPPHLGYLTLLRGRFCNSSKLCSCFFQN